MDTLDAVVLLDIIEEHVGHHRVSSAEFKTISDVVEAIRAGLDPVEVQEEIDLDGEAE